jgi:hypothetical protein
MVQCQLSQVQNLGRDIYCRITLPIKKVIRVNRAIGRRKTSKSEFVLHEMFMTR